MTVQKIKSQQYRKGVLPWRFGSHITECFYFAVLRCTTPLDERFTHIPSFDWLNICRWLAHWDARLFWILTQSVIQAWKHHIIGITWALGHWNLSFVVWDIISCDPRSWQLPISLFQHSLPDTQCCVAVILGSHSGYKKFSWAKQLGAWTPTALVLSLGSFFQQAIKQNQLRSRSKALGAHGRDPLVTLLSLSVTALVDTEAPVSHPPQWWQ